MPVIADRPVVEKIAEALFDRLQRLVAGRSSTTVASEVIRAKRMGGWTPKNLQIVLTQSDPERNEELSHPGNPPAMAFDIRFNIRCHVIPSELDPTAVDTYINAMTADVINCITRDADWYNFGGLAVNSQFDAIEQIDSDGSFDGANVPLNVTYRVSETNQYEVRA